MTACGGSTSDSAGPSSTPQSGSSADELPATTQLMIGTLKLEGTAQAVTAEQAVELLPLWQTMQVLSDSDTAAEEEKEALIAQIQETMTAGQMQAIRAMNLTREDMLTIMQEQGMAMGSATQSRDSQSGDSSSGRVFGPGGGPPDGIVMSPDERGPGFGGQGQNLSADQIATARAARQQGSSIQPMLINAVIEYLQEKAGS